MDNNRYVVSVGAGKNQVPLIKRLVERGYNVISFDKNPTSPGKYWSYRFNNISTWNYEDAIQWLDTLDIKFKGILCFSYGKALVTQQKLINYYKLPAQIKDDFVFIMEDKAVQRKLLDNLALSTLKEYNRFEEIPHKFSDKRFIVKDKMGGSSNNIFLLEPVNRNNKTLKDCVIQEYIEGTEFRVICLVENKNITFIAIMERTNFDNTFYTGRLNPENKIDQSMWNFVKKIVERISINDSVIKIDLIKKDDRIEIIELDFGIGGDYFETFISPLCYQYNFIDNYINLMLGLQVWDEYKIDDDLCFDYVYNLNREKVITVNYGIIRSICDNNFQSFKLINIKEEGDKVHYPKSNMDALFAIVHNRKDLLNRGVSLLFNEALSNEVLR